MGRPLPGSAEVRLAAYDAHEEKLKLGKGGFVRRCRSDEVGLLIARARPSEWTSTPMRGVFARDDAWLSTGDLFRRDADGDYWRLDGVRDVIHTAAGPVLGGPIRDALGDLTEVDLAVSYGVRPDAAESDLALAAVTLRPDMTLEADALTHVLGVLAPEARPAVVHVVARIPVTTWFRPMTAALREAGLPRPGEGGQAWYLERGGRRYRTLTEAAWRRLSGTGR
jgi:putative long chain acyl-CoA synthase